MTERRTALQNRPKPLASIVDVEALLQRHLTPEEKRAVGQFLAKLSAQFRLEAQVRFGSGTATQRLKVTGGTVYLNEQGVTSVVEVTDDAGNLLDDYRIAGQWLRGLPLSDSRFVTVQYTYDAPVPDLVRITVAQGAIRALKASQADADLVKSQSESFVGFQLTRNYQPSATSLTADDIRVARTYRPMVPRLWVMQP